VRQRRASPAGASVEDLVARIPNMFDSQPVILDLLADGRLLWNDEIQQLVASHFRLTPEEQEWPHPDHARRDRSYFSNQTAWALSRLQSPYGYIVKPTRSILRYRITATGKRARRDRTLVSVAEERGVRTRPGGAPRLPAKRSRTASQRARTDDRRAPLSVSYRPVDEEKRLDHDPFEYDPDERDRQTLAHARLQNRVAELARAAGYTVHQPGPGDPVKFDLAWTVGDRRAVVEIKTLSTTRADAKQLRLAVGQVLDYQHQLRAAGADVRAIVVVDKRPRDRHWFDLCASYGIELAWPATLRKLFT
jgi:Mrr N-terminal domain